jgi:hypothetical protein
VTLADDAAVELAAEWTDPNGTRRCSACRGRGCGEPDYFGNRDACDRCEGTGIEGGPDALRPEP